MCTKLSLTLHNSIILIPAYKLELQQEVPATRSVWKWSDDVDATLQDCFASTDWNMFRDSSDGIEEYTTTDIGFINKCIDDVVPTVTIRTYPNQKPWITGNIHTELKARAAAFKELIRTPIRNPGSGKLVSRKATRKHALEHQLLRTTA